MEYITQKLGIPRQTNKTSVLRVFSKNPDNISGMNFFFFFGFLKKCIKAGIIDNGTSMLLVHK